MALVSEKNEPEMDQAPVSHVPYTGTEETASVPLRGRAGMGCTLPRCLPAPIQDVLPAVTSSWAEGSQEQRFLGLCVGKGDPTVKILAQRETSREGNPCAVLLWEGKSLHMKNAGATYTIDLLA